MQIKIGIVGMGNIFQKHYPVIKNNKSFQIVALCDRNYKTKNKNSSVPFYSNIKQMLSKKKDIELVILLTPSGLHFKQIKMCLITGGEPTIHETLLQDILNLFKKHNFFTAIETNGTNYVPLTNLDFISISPKLENSIPIPNSEFIIKNKKIEQEINTSTNPLSFCIVNCI